MDPGEVVVVSSTTQRFPGSSHEYVKEQLTSVSYIIHTFWDCDSEYYNTEEAHIETE